MIAEHQFSQEMMKKAKQNRDRKRQQIAQNANVLRIGASDEKYDVLTGIKLDAQNGFDTVSNLQNRLNDVIDG